MNAHTFCLQGMTVLVAGATGDIGTACCRVMVGQGARVVATGRDRSKLTALQEGAGVHGVFAADLTEGEVSADLAQRIEPLDGVVFAGGRFALRPVRLQSRADWEALMGINVTSPMWLTRELLRAGKLREGGTLVFLSSVLGTRGASGYTAYAASKGALNAFVRSLALELAGSRIRAVTVSPGMVASRMAERTAELLPGGLASHWSQYPLGPGTVDDVAWAVSYVVSPAARWLTGIDLVVDGGWSVR